MVKRFGTNPWRGAGAVFGFGFLLFTTVAGSAAVLDFWSAVGDLQKKERVLKAQRNYKEIISMAQAARAVADRGPEFEALVHATIASALDDLGEYTSSLWRAETGLVSVKDPKVYDRSFQDLNGKRLLTAGAVALLRLGRYDLARKAAAALGTGTKLIDDHEADEKQIIQTLNAEKPILQKFNAEGKAPPDDFYRATVNLYLSMLGLYFHKSYITSSNLPSLNDLWNRTIDNALKLSPPPLIPAEARKQAIFAQTAVKNAKQPSDFEAARKEYHSALILAPWWADVWVNLSAVDEELGRYTNAANDLRFYLRAAPNAPDRGAVETKIYELQYKAEQYRK
jgi:tetratricopeptide (TPR) repeat protein